MPRRVDHEERRAEISDALVRVASRDGLCAVTMRTVAGEAGISLRLVQYYFETRARLMSYTLERMERRSTARWTDRLESVSEPHDARAVLEALFEEALPTDPASRDFHMLSTSFAMLSVTDTSLESGPIVEGTGRIEAEVAALLRRASGVGELVTEPELDAAGLMALVHGLGTGVMIGLRTADEAREIFQLHLDRMFV